MANHVICVLSSPPCCKLSLCFHPRCRILLHHLVYVKAGGCGKSWRSSAPDRRTTLRYLPNVPRRQSRETCSYIETLRMKFPQPPPPPLPSAIAVRDGCHTLHLYAPLLSSGYTTVCAAAPANPPKTSVGTAPMRSPGPRNLCLYTDLHQSYTKKLIAPYGATRTMLAPSPFHNARGPSRWTSPFQASLIRIPVEVTRERKVSTGWLSAVPTMEASEPPINLSRPSRSTTTRAWSPPPPTPL